jgi:putative ABC transport system permease protein
VPALAVSHELLPLLGISPLLGRSFTADDDAPGAGDRVLISERLWEREFGRQPDVVGRTLRLDDRASTIVGVMRNDADFGVLQILSAAAYSRAFADRGERIDIDVWAPLQADPQQLPRSTHPIFVAGRLAEGAQPDAAQAEMARIMSDLERAYPENAARGAFVEPVANVVFAPVRPAFFMLLGAVALVLIVAVVNVAGLLFARGAAREQELAVRGALGASRGQLIRLFFAESLVITAASTALGVAIAYAALRTIVSLAPADVPRLATASIDVRVLLVTIGVSALVAFAFALFPLIQGSALQHSLAEGTGRTSRGGTYKLVQRMLAVAELALAVVLVCGAALLIRSFWRVHQVDPGFRAAGVLKLEYQLPPSRYPSNFQRWPDFVEQHAFVRSLLDRARALPGVTAAAIAGNHPLDPGFTNSFVIVGREAEARTWPEISIRRVTAGYFQTVGVPLLRGRLLQESDTTQGAAVVLINEAAAQRFFPSSDPIGARMRFWGTSRTIVGIVGNERVHGLIAAAPIAAYTPLSQTPSATGALLLRTTLDPRSLAAAGERVIHELDPGLAIFGVEPLQQTLARSVSQRRFSMLLLGTFAALALLLAAVGMHALLTYTVAQRTKEIGIRMALGARHRTVLAMFVREGLTITAAGLGLGLAGALIATRLLRTLLFGITPTDPLAFAAVVGVLLTVALAATIVPAYRAARIDPLRALRSETP